METGLRPNRAGIPYTLLLRMEAIGFPIFGLLLYIKVIITLLTKSHDLPSRVSIREVYNDYILLEY